MSESGSSHSHYMTSQETVELARLQQDPNVIGTCLLSMEGDKIESSGQWSEMIPAVFANAAVLANKVGEEFGEAEICQRMQVGNRDLEIIAVTLSACQAIIVKRKQAKAREGLRSVI